LDQALEAQDVSSAQRLLDDLSHAVIENQDVRNILRHEMQYFQTEIQSLSYSLEKTESMQVSPDQELVQRLSQLIDSIREADDVSSVIYQAHELMGWIQAYKNHVNNEDMKNQLRPGFLKAGGTEDMMLAWSILEVSNQEIITLADIAKVMNTALNGRLNIVLPDVVWNQSDFTVARKAGVSEPTDHSISSTST
jgi:hypothetical protein